MNGINGFVLGGLSSWDYGIIMTAAPPIVFGQRDTDVIPIAGRSGDLTVDNGRYRNISIPYKCAILPDSTQSLREAAFGASAILLPSAGYKRLENTYHPDSFRLARISSDISIESIVEQAGNFTLKFDCKPQHFLKSGEYPVAFTAPGTLYNTTDFHAKPIITVYGTAAGTVTVGGVTVEIKSITDQITLDCEIMDAYRNVGEGGTENMNGTIYAPDFPELTPGENVVSWTGGITGVDIIPRWWTL